MNRFARIVLVTVLVCISVFKISAQTGEVVVKSDGDITKVVIDSLKYVLPQFEKGTIYFKQRPKSDAVLNISTIYPSISFIQGKDTLVLTKELESVVSFVQVGDRVWKKGIGYVEVIDKFSGLELGVERVLEFDKPKKQGAYGYAPENASVEVVNQVGNLYVDPILNERYLNIPYRYILRTYIIQEGKYHIPTKKVFRRIFPGKEKQIDSYIKDNKVNFRRVNDVKELFEYCKEL